MKAAIDSVRRRSVEEACYISSSSAGNLSSSSSAGNLSSSSSAGNHILAGSIIPRDLVDIDARLSAVDQARSARRPGLSARRPGRSARRPAVIDQAVDEKP
eukprot:gene119-272_t